MALGSGSKPFDPVCKLDFLLTSIWRFQSCNVKQFVTCIVLLTIREMIQSIQLVAFQGTAKPLSGGDTAAAIRQQHHHPAVSARPAMRRGATASPGSGANLLKCWVSKQATTEGFSL